jgi:hypothetical protein
MVSVILRLAPAVTTFIFALLAFIFSLLATTSKKWAVRHNYDPSLNTLDWKDPIYTLYRSPFTVCTAELVNSTLTIGSAASPADFAVKCTQFRPRGFNRTSCELAIATQDDTAPTIGDARLCQQIHYAGDFGIASTTFIGLAFVLVLVLVIVTLVKRPEFATESYTSVAKAAPPNDGSPLRSEQDVNQQAASVVPARGSAWVAWVDLILLTFLFVGFSTALISQYYGVIGLIQSLPNNADFASSQGGGADDVNTHGSHGPWYQGIGLSVYATCAWGFSISAGVVASKAWPLPQWRVVL